MKALTYPLCLPLLCCSLLISFIPAVTKAQSPWSAPAPLWGPDVPYGGIYQHDAKVASDGENTVVAAWTAGNDIVCAKSTDGGASWTPPAEVTTEPLTLGRHAQTLVYTGSAWVLYWRAYNGAAITLEEGYLSRSTDGIAWSVPMRVDKKIQWGTTDDSLLNRLGGDMASDGAGTVVALVDFAIVYRSADSGLSWTSSTLASVPSAQYDSRRLSVAYNGGTWYLGISGQKEFASEPPNFTRLFKSTDGANTWTESDVTAQVTQITDLAAYEGTILVTSYPDVLLSADGGDTWSVATPADMYPYIPEQLFVDKNGTWFMTQEHISSSNYLAYASSDPAAGWTTLQRPADQAFAVTPDFAEITSGILMVGHLPPDYSSWPAREQQIVSQVTDDGGLTWSEARYVTGEIPVLYYQPDLVLASDGRGEVRALWSTNNWLALQKYIPETDSWTTPTAVTRIDSGLPYSINLTPAGPSNWLISEKEQQSAPTFRQFKSTDGGTSWTEIASHAADPVAWSDRGTIVSTTPYPALKYSLDRMDSASWDWTSSLQLSAPAEAVVHTSGKNWFAISASYIYTSTDDGRSWIREREFGSTLPATIVQLAADPRGAAMLLVSVASAPGTMDIYSLVTKDNGRHWTPPAYVNKQPGSVAHTSLLPVGMGMWMIAYETDSFEFKTFLTKNDGATWETLELSTPGEDGPTTFRGQHPTLALAHDTAILAYDSFSRAYYATMHLDIPKAAAADWQLFE
jgi:photosystem II stability/assembly factor-like uncharacterized protein